MSKGTAKVKASAKGYFIGPREVGDVFDMPLKPDGTPMKGSWFEVLSIDTGEKPEPAPEPTKQLAQISTVLTDEDSLA